MKTAENQLEATKLTSPIKNVIVNFDIASLSVN